MRNPNDPVAKEIVSFKLRFFRGIVTFLYLCGVTFFVFIFIISQVFQFFGDLLYRIVFSIKYRNYETTKVTEGFFIVKNKKNHKYGIIRGLSWVFEDRFLYIKHRPDYQINFSLNGHYEDETHINKLKRK